MLEVMVVAVSVERAAFQHTVVVVAAAPNVRTTTPTADDGRHKVTVVEVMGGG